MCTTVLPGTHFWTSPSSRLERNFGGYYFDMSSPLSDLNLACLVDGTNVFTFYYRGQHTLKCVQFTGHLNRLKLISRPLYRQYKKVISLAPLQYEPNVLREHTASVSSWSAVPFRISRSSRKPQTRNQSIDQKCY